MSNISKGSEKIHELTIEVCEGEKQHINDTFPYFLYNLYDNRSVAHLGDESPHVIVRINYNATNPGDCFLLQAQPGNLKKNFSHILKWTPEQVVSAIIAVENHLYPTIKKRIFSKSKKCKLQSYGLARELYRKGLKEQY